MDEQQTTQVNDQVVQSTPHPSPTLWYVVGAVAILAALGLWYFSGNTPSDTGSETADETSAAAISAEVEQLPDDSTELNQDAAASAQAVQGF